MEAQPGSALPVSGKADLDLTLEHKSDPSTGSGPLLLLFAKFAAIVGFLYASSLVVNAPSEPVAENEHDLLARTYINAIPRCVVRAHSSLYSVCHD